jgi:type IV pilus assembly protein PilM
MLFRSKTMLGLDLGSHSVKIVELQGSAGRYRLTRLGQAPMPAESIVQGSFMNAPAIADAIREAYKAGGFRGKDVATSVSGHSVIVKRISLPRQTADELGETIRWEAPQYIPFDINEVHLDYQILQEATVDDQMDVLLVAAKKDLVNDYVNVISEAGLNLAIMDVDAFALGNMFEANYDAPPGQAVALVNIGSAVTNINVMAGKVPIFTRDITSGGNLYTEEIQKALGISFSEAEQIKIGGGDSAGRDVVPQEVDVAMREISEGILGEIQRSLDFYRATTSEIPIAKVVLCGGSAHVPGLDRLFEERIEVPFEIANPFARIETPASVMDAGKLREIAPSLAVAVGLGLRRLGEE